MIVQPASLGPSGRPRRVLRIVGLVVPVLLLGGVVAAGRARACAGCRPHRPLPSSPSPRRPLPPSAPAPSPEPEPGVAVFPSIDRRPRRARRPLDARGAQPRHRPGSRRGRGLPRPRFDPRRLRGRRAARDLRPVLRADRGARRGSLVRRHEQRAGRARVPSPPAVPRRRAHALAGDQRRDLAIHRDAAGRHPRAVQRPAGEAVRARLVATAGWSWWSSRSPGSTARRTPTTPTAGPARRRPPTTRSPRSAATRRWRRRSWRPARTRCSPRSSIRRRSRRSSRAPRPPPLA